MRNSQVSTIISPWYQDHDLSIYNLDAFAFAKQLKTESVDCIVTSPPYWNLRDYAVDGQWGTERIVGQYVDNLVYFFSAMRSKLKSDEDFLRLSLRIRLQNGALPLLGTEVRDA